MDNMSIKKYLFLNGKNTPYILYINICMLVIIIVTTSLSFYINIVKYNIMSTQVIKEDNEYLLKISCPIKDNKYIIDNSYLYVEDKEYKYKINKIDNILYTKNNIDYQTIYLSVDLDDKYKINNLVISIKIVQSKEKIIDIILNYFFRKE